MFERLESEDIPFVVHLYQSTRIQLNLTIEDVAKELGGSLREWRRKVRDLERGRRLESAQDYLKIGEVLGLDLEELGEQLAARREERWHIPAQDIPLPIFGDRLERRRGELGLTYLELLERLGWRRGGFREWRLRKLCAGRHRFASGFEIEKLSEALELDINVLKSARAAEYAYYDRVWETPKLLVQYYNRYYVETPIPELDDTAQAISFAGIYGESKGVSVGVLFVDGRCLIISSAEVWEERFNLMYYKSK